MVGTRGTLKSGPVHAPDGSSNNNNSIDTSIKFHSPFTAKPAAANAGTDTVPTPAGTNTVNINTNFASHQNSTITMSPTTIHHQQHHHHHAAAAAAAAGASGTGKSGKRKRSQSNSNGDGTSIKIDVKWQDPLLVFNGIYLERGTATKAASNSSDDNDIIKLEVNKPVAPSSWMTSRNSNSDFASQPSHSRASSPLKRRKMSRQDSYQTQTQTQTQHHDEGHHINGADDALPVSPVSLKRKARERDLPASQQTVESRAPTPPKRRKLSHQKGSPQQTLNDGSKAVSGTSLADEAPRTSAKRKSVDSQAHSIPSRASTPSTKRRRLSAQPSQSTHDNAFDAENADDFAEKVSSQLAEEVNRSIPPELNSEQLHDPTSEPQFIIPEHSAPLPVPPGLLQGVEPAKYPPNEPLQQPVGPIQIKIPRIKSPALKASDEEGGNESDEESDGDDDEEPGDENDEDDDEDDRAIRSRALSEVRINADPDILEDHDLPPPFLPKPTELLPREKYEDEAAMLLCKVYPPLPSTTSLVNALTGHHPSTRSTETLFRLATNTQKLLRAWQDEFMNIDKRTAPTSNQVGRKQASGGRTPLDHDAWEAHKRDEVLAKLGVNYWPHSNGSKGGSEKRELRRRKADAAIITQAVGSENDTAGTGNERSGRRERRPVRRFESGTNENNSNPPAAPSTSVSTRSATAGTSSRGRPLRNRGGRPQTLSRRATAAAAAAAAAAAGPTTRIDEPASSAGADPNSRIATPQVGTGSNTATGPGSRDGTTTPLPSSGRHGDNAQSAQNGPKSEKRSESMQLWWAARKKRWAEEKIQKLRDEGKLDLIPAEEAKLAVEEEKIRAIRQTMDSSEKKENVDGQSDAGESSSAGAADVNTTVNGSQNPTKNDRRARKARSSSRTPTDVTTAETENANAAKATSPAEIPAGSSVNGAVATSIPTAAAAAGSFSSRTPPRIVEPPISDSDGKKVSSRSRSPRTKAAALSSSSSSSPVVKPGQVKYSSPLATAAPLHISHYPDEPPASLYPDEQPRSVYPNEKPPSLYPDEKPQSLYPPTPVSQYPPPVHHNPHYPYPPPPPPQHQRGQMPPISPFHHPAPPVPDWQPRYQQQSLPPPPAPLPHPGQAPMHQSLHRPHLSGGYQPPPPPPHHSQPPPPSGHYGSNGPLPPPYPPHQAYPPQPPPHGSHGAPPPTSPPSHHHHYDPPGQHSHGGPFPPPPLQTHQYQPHAPHMPPPPPQHAQASPTSHSAPQSAGNFDKWTTKVGPSAQTHPRSPAAASPPAGDWQSHQYRGPPAGSSPGHGPSSATSKGNTENSGSGSNNNAAQSQPQSQSPSTAAQPYRHQTHQARGSWI